MMRRKMGRRRRLTYTLKRERTRNEERESYDGDGAMDGKGNDGIWGILVFFFTLNVFFSSMVLVIPFFFYGFIQFFFLFFFSFFFSFFFFSSGSSIPFILFFSYYNCRLGLLSVGILRIWVMQCC